MVDPLLSFLTAWVIALIEGLRGGCDQHIRRVFLDPACRSDTHIRRMIQELKQGEQRTWREIREAALRELGIPFQRQSLEFYARPKSRTPQALRARLQAYETMLRDPEACVRRLVAKLRADRKLSMLDRLRGPRLPVIGRVFSLVLISLVSSRLTQRAAPVIHPPSFSASQTARPAIGRFRDREPMFRRASETITSDASRMRLRERKVADQLAGVLNATQRPSSVSQPGRACDMPCPSRSAGGRRQRFGCGIVFASPPGDGWRRRRGGLTFRLMSGEHHPLALVTGASSGIGAAFARALAARGDDVVLVARRVDRLEALAKELEAKHGVQAHVIVADLSAVDAHLPIMETLKARGLAVDTLVNNAGYSLAPTYAKTTWPEQRDFVMTLVMAVCGLTHALLPGMIARGHGAIITVGSMAALAPGGVGHTLYPAAKSFVLKFSLSLDAELRAKGIKVTCSLPGFTESEFAEVNGTADIMAKSSRKFVMPAERVVDATLKASAEGRVISIPGTSNKIGAGLLKLLPDGVSARIIRRAAEKYRVHE